MLSASAGHTVLCIAKIALLIPEHSLTTQSIHRLIWPC